MLLRQLLLGGFLLLASTAAWAERAPTSEALERMGEALQPALEGPLNGVVPLMIVGAAPAFEETRASFPTAVVASLAGVFGGANLRACEACMTTRVDVADGRLVHNSVTVSLEEIVAIDARTRGTAAPARAAIWVDETADGITIRIVSLENGQILYARNFDGALREEQRSGQVFNLTSDVQRRLRGESLTHLFIDGALYPNFHISADVVDQFGTRNLDLAGITMSLVDPVFGVGAVYYRVIPEAFNLTVGGQVVVSIPTAAGNALSGATGGAIGDLIDPLLTAVLVARWPIPQTSYAVLLTASTNGQVGVGISLMNVGFLPVLP